MPATDTRNLQLSISASAELLVRNLRKADNAVADFQQVTNKRLTAIDERFAALGALKGKLASLNDGIGLGGIATAATGITLVELARRGLEFASSLGEVAQQVGVTTKALQELRYAGSQYGLTQDEVDTGLTKLTATLGQAKLGAEGPIKAFGAIGVSLDDIRTKSPSDLFAKIADGLSRIGDAAARAAIERELFGKAGQKFDPLLTTGAAGINQLADAAQRLGLVLSDDQIQRADDTADKLSAVKQVLEANIAGVVADNSTAILNLANAIGTLTGNIVQFLAADPAKAYALIGALIGSRFGLPGAIAGGTIGFVTGAASASEGQDRNMNIAFRLQKVREAEAKVRQAQGRGVVALPLGPDDASPVGVAGNQGADLNAARRELIRQRGLLTQAFRGGAPKPAAAPTASSGPLPQLLGGGGGSKAGGGDGGAARAAAAARKDRQDQRRASDLLSRGEVDLLAARADLENDPEKRLDIERQRIDLARQARDRDLEEQALDNRYIAANLDRLKSINAQNAALDKQLLAQRRAQETEQEEYDRTRAAADDSVALLEIGARLAVIARDRQEIERPILAAKQEEERQALQRVVDNRAGAYTPSQVLTARQSLDRLPERQAAERDALAFDQRGVLAQYRDQLKAATGDMSEALDGVKVHALQNLEDGLLGLIDGTESVASAFRKMAASIIADLARIAIEKAILGALGGGFLGIKLAGGGEVKKLAGGGPVWGAGTATSDSIPAMLSNGEFVLDAATTRAYRPIIEAMHAGRLRRFADGGPVVPSIPSVGGRGGFGGVQTIRIHLDDDLNARIDSRAAGVSVEVVRGMAPAIQQGAVPYVMHALTGPRL